MKKIIRLFILLMAVFITTNAYAATVSIGASKTSAYVGDSVTVTVKIYAGTWNLSVSGPGISDKIVGYDMDGNTTITKNYKVDTSSVGTKTITLTGDISDYETEETTRGISKTVTINVINPPATQPTTKKTTQPKTTKATQATTTTVTVPVATEPTTTTTIPIEPINITEFKIVGYQFAFNKDIHEYVLNVNEGVEELYVIVNGNDLSVTNTGIVNIKDNKFDVVVKKGEQVETYTFIIERGEVKGEQELDYITKKGYITIIAILAILVILLLFVLLYYLATAKKGI